MLIDRTHALPITQQAKVLNISRGSVYYRPRPVSAGDLGVMRRLDQSHLDYLAAVVDWFSRRVLAWRLSITMEAGFCVEALEEALARRSCSDKPSQLSLPSGSNCTGGLLPHHLRARTHTLVC
jgi:transposase InsO family protein